MRQRDAGGLPHAFTGSSILEVTPVRLIRKRWTRRHSPSSSRLQCRALPWWHGRLGDRPDEGGLGDGHRGRRLYIGEGHDAKPDRGGSV